jgi:hypothetical protein
MATVTEVFPCFFLSCKTNARVKPAKTGHGCTLPNFCVVGCIVYFVSFSVLFVCVCVLNYCTIAKYCIFSSLRVTDVFCG